MLIKNKVSRKISPCRLVVTNASEDRPAFIFRIQQSEKGKLLPSSSGYHEDAGWNLLQNFGTLQQLMMDISGENTFVRTSQSHVKFLLKCIKEIFIEEHRSRCYGRIAALKAYCETL
jgi:hypothetical protein